MTGSHPIATRTQHWVIVPVDGGGELTLKHTMLGKFVEYKQRPEQGWGMILDGLARSL